MWMKLRSLLRYSSNVNRKVFSSAASHEDLVLVEKIRNTTLIGINRPNKRNCIDHETAKQLLAAVKEFDNDEDSIAAVLYGVGGNFCSGYDLSEIHDNPQKIQKVMEEVKRTPGMGPMGPTFYETKKPVIAAVEGYAVAGGLELALWCDIRIIDETACLGFLNRRFGVPLIDGGTVRLPAIVGMGRALELIITGSRVNGREAFNMGLANVVTDTGTAIGKALGFAQSLRKFPQQCMRRDRSLIFESVYGSTSLIDSLERERDKISPEVLMEAAKGASKFQSGIGRHGSSSLDSLEEIMSDLDVEIEK